MTTSVPGKRDSSLRLTAQPMGGGHDSANEKPLYLEVPVSSNGLRVYNRPFQGREEPPVLSFRTRVLCRHTAYEWSTYERPLNCTSLLFPNKPILLKVSKLLLKVGTLVKNANVSILPPALLDRQAGNRTQNSAFYSKFCLRTMWPHVMGEAWAQMR